MQGNTFMVVGFYQDFKMPEISGPSNDISWKSQKAEPQKRVLLLIHNYPLPPGSWCFLRLADLWQ